MIWLFSHYSVLICKGWLHHGQVEIWIREVLYLHFSIPCPLCKSEEEMTEEHLETCWIHHRKILECTRANGFIAKHQALDNNNNSIFSTIFIYDQYLRYKLAALAQIVACLPLVQQVWVSIPGGVVNFHLKVFNLGARRGEMYTF